MLNLENMSFVEIVNNLKFLKAQYSLLLSPFFNAKEIRRWKNAIYSLPYAEWKLNIIWADNKPDSIFLFHGLHNF